MVRIRISWANFDSLRPVFGEVNKHIGHPALLYVILSESLPYVNSTMPSSSIICVFFPGSFSAINESRQICVVLARCGIEIELDMNWRSIEWLWLIGWLLWLIDLMELKLTSALILLHFVTYVAYVTCRKYSAQLSMSFLSCKFEVSGICHSFPSSSSSSCGPNDWLYT